MVQWTISSDERRELKRAAGYFSLAPRPSQCSGRSMLKSIHWIDLPGSARRVSHLKNQWVERRYRSANPMIFLPLPQGERRRKRFSPITTCSENVATARPLFLMVARRGPPLRFGSADAPNE